MRVVLDTNVLVSALLKSTGAPAQVLEAVLEGRLVVVFDDRILEEYREVLARPKFARAIDPQAASAVIEFIVAAGERVTASGAAVTVVDPKDAAFIEVALTGGVDAIVTGNQKHFPANVGARVLSPAELIASLA